jgi:hypothetical protein
LWGALLFNLSIYRRWFKKIIMKLPSSTTSETFALSPKFIWTVPKELSARISIHMGILISATALNKE